MASTVFTEMNDETSTFFMRNLRWVILTVCIVSLAASGAMLYAAHHHEPPPVVITSSDPESTPPAPISSKSLAPSVISQTRLYVHVAGAVKKPSLYKLPPGSHIMDALQAAGGPTPPADIDAINLAEKVQDGEKIYIPIKNSPLPAQSATHAGNILSRASVVPTAAADISAAKIQVIRGTSTPALETVSAGHSSKSSSLAAGQIDLNTATIDELQQLPGIGATMAKRILDYRTQSGHFQKPDDIMEVPGIGEKRYAKIAPFVCVQ